MGEKTKIFVEDLILIIVSIVGVGFAGGAEIEHFFCSTNFYVLIIIFLFLFAIFFNVIYNFKQKNNVKSFYELNNILFPKAKIINYLFIIFHLVLSASMLAGADVLVRDKLGLTLPIVSVLLNIFVYILILKGVAGIKKIFSKFVPILLLIIFINLFVNSFYLTHNFKNLSNMFTYNDLFSKQNTLTTFMPFLFFGSNFVLAINSIINLRGNQKKISALAIVLFGVFLFFGCITILLNKNGGDMPLLSASKNLSNVFFWIYYLCLIFSIFATLTISTWNEFQLCNFDNNFSLIIILIVNQIVSLLGFQFIIKYLYSFTGLVGIIYCVILLIRIKIFNHHQNKNTDQTLMQNNNK